VTDRRLDNVSAAVQAAVEAGVVPGAVALVRHRGEDVLHEAFGSASLVPDKRPMTTDTLFDLASLTKPIVGAGVALALVDRGIVSLDEEITTWLPELDQFRGKGVTVRRVLAHTAGVTGWRPLYTSAEGADAVVRAIDALGVAAPPGSRFEYSDLGYILLGVVLERAAGTTLATLAGELLFQPCGLASTGYLPEDAPDRFAVTEEGNAFERRMAEWAGLEFGRWRTTFHPGEVNDGNAHYGLGGVSAHAGLFSTAADVATLGEMWLRRGAHEGRQVLSPAVVVAALDDQAPPGPARRGLGWDLARCGGPMLEEIRRADAGYFPPTTSPFTPRSSGELLSASAFGHTGFTGTSMWIDPQLELVAVLLTNATHPRVDLDKPVNALRARFANAAAASCSAISFPGHGGR
jgi:CubicO group peptidase (beta-lactamase class C family)